MDMIEAIRERLADGEETPRFFGGFNLCDYLDFASFAPIPPTNIISLC